MGQLLIKDLTKVYEKEKIKIQALRGIDLTIQDHSFVAVTGTSGSGKSTLLHILAGIDNATSGEVWLDGTRLDQLSRDDMTVFRRRNIGLIYQFYNLVSVLTVEENITLPAMLDKKKPDTERLNELLKMFHLEERRKHFPSELSGGQQQRVAIARALYNQPSIVLADEPTGNLDSENREDVMAALRMLNKTSNITVIMVTHDPEIASSADRIITIKDGLVVRDEVNKKND